MFIIELHSDCETNLILIILFATRSALQGGAEWGAVETQRKRKFQNINVYPFNVSAHRAILQLLCYSYIINI